jgi:hypothetical protein
VTDSIQPLAPDSTFGQPDHTMARLDDTYPAFRFTYLTHGWHGPRWVAVRENSTDQGLYAVITADLEELQAALLLGAAQTTRGLPVSQTATPSDSLL